MELAILGITMVIVILIAVIFIKEVVGLNRKSPKNEEEVAIDKDIINDKIKELKTLLYTYEKSIKEGAVATKNETIAKTESILNTIETVSSNLKSDINKELGNNETTSLK